MPRRRSGLLLFLVLLSTPLLVPEEPWRAKDVTQWTLAEIDKLLWESPWVKVVTIGPSGADRPPMKRRLLSDQEENAMIARKLHHQLGSTPSIQTPPPDPAPQKSQIAIRWLSSQTIRAGVAQFWYLQGQANPQAMQALVNYEPEQYAIGIAPIQVWSDSSAGAKIGLHKLVGRLKETAYLAVDKGPRIPALAVEIPRGLSLTPAAAVIIYFPLQSDGKPTIPSDARKVRFHCDLDTYVFQMPSGVFSAKVTQVDVTFDIAKMTRAGKPDL